MGYIAKDRREQDALDVYRIKRMAVSFMLQVWDITGKDCRLHPELRFSVGDLASAITDLEKEANGLLDRYDPDRELDGIEGRFTCAEQSRKIGLPLSAEDEALLSSQEDRWSPRGQLIAAE